MMNFKNWLNENILDDLKNYQTDTEEDDWFDLDDESEKVFGQRDINKSVQFNTILSHLGLPGVNHEVKPFAQGSMATVYQNPHNPNTIIKVTSDINDIQNLIKAQTINSPNVVRLHNSKLVSNTLGVALLDYVKGKTLNLSIDGIMRLVQGERNDDFEQAIEGIFDKNDKLRNQVLKMYGMDDDKTRQKWSDLFKAVYQLESLGIYLDDLTDNIIDNGSQYVLIDLGLKL